MCMLYNSIHDNENVNTNSTTLVHFRTLVFNLVAAVEAFEFSCCIIWILATSVLEYGLPCFGNTNIILLKAKCYDYYILLLIFVIVCFYIAHVYTLIFLFS